MEKITPQDLAAQLAGIPYPVNIPSDLQAKAKANRLVIVFGASDDLMELRGAIHDEVGVDDGEIVHFDRQGLLYSDGVDEDDWDAITDYTLRMRYGARPLKAMWCPEGRLGLSWAYETPIPHATFDVLEDGVTYCRGIVFSLDELYPREEAEGDDDGEADEESTFTVEVISAAGAPTEPGESMRELPAIPSRFGSLVIHYALGEALADFLTQEYEATSQQVFDILEGADELVEAKLAHPHLNRKVMVRMLLEKAVMAAKLMPARADSGGAIDYTQPVRYQITDSEGFGIESTIHLVELSNSPLCART